MRTYSPITRCVKKAGRCLAAGILLLPAACGEYVLVSKEGSEQLIEGQRLRYLSDDAKAEQVLKQAYGSSARRVKAEAAFQLAQLSQKKQQHDETLRYLEDAYRAGYNGSPVRLAKAYLEASPGQRNYAKAEAILQQYKHQSPDAALTLAKLYVEKRQFAKAFPPLALAETMYGRSQAPARDALQIAGVYRDIYLHPAAPAYPKAGEAARRWYTLAMRKGDSQDAPVELAQLIMHNAPAYSSPFYEGTALLQQAAARNNLKAMEALGRSFYAAAENEKALYWFTEREQKGDPDGSQAYAIAKVYKRIKEEDPAHLAMMEEWYGRAMAKGNREAKQSWQEYQTQEYLKQVVRLERDARREELRRMTTLTPDDEKGYAMLLDGGDKDKAYRYFKSLADSGRSLHAMLMVDSWKEGNTQGDIYQSTYSNVEPRKLFSAVAQNASQLGDGHKEQIVRQWNLAARYGSGGAAYQLAQYYESADPALARQWMAKAIEMGDGKALLHKAREAAVNGGDERTDEQIFVWYKKAAEAGEVEGQYQTGRMYAEGRGVAKNPQQAKYWMNQAKNNGYHLASEATALE